jgi:hypothetical protein
LQPPMLCQSWPASHPIKSQSRFVIGVDTLVQINLPKVLVKNLLEIFAKWLLFFGQGRADTMPPIEAGTSPPTF